MSDKVLLEDTVAYVNDYWKDTQARDAGQQTMTLSQAANQLKNHPNNIIDTFLPYPGQQIVDMLGSTHSYISALYLLMQQLFNNPGVNYPEEVQEKSFHYLTSITENLTLLSEELDKWHSEAEEERPLK